MFFPSKRVKKERTKKRREMTSKPIASFFQPPKRLRVAEPNSKEFQLNNPSEEEEEDLNTQALKRPLIIGDPTRKLPQEQSIRELAGELSVHNKVEQKASEISKEQKMRMEINKASARAKRNLRACQDRVAEAQGMYVCLSSLYQRMTLAASLRRSFTRRLQS